ncbi:hypothetical protein LY78DRAFT_364421 [Colletotrichum sublineola]|nr:hypothetical protein LY78DRAFT_364421 [Colletotrichum sublineola]
MLSLEELSTSFDSCCITSRIYMEIISLAKAGHPRFVSCGDYHGTNGHLRPIHIYGMNRLPRTSYVIARDISGLQLAVMLRSEDL